MSVLLDNAASDVTIPPAAVVGGIGAEREFGFKAATSFEVGLRKTIEWYKGALPS
ncbi:protein of unknown function [Candidatus Methylomirabilis oxygeniifera]|uniref:Uncharacterized protein n=1 Tax=Methylomirabilis oxygeniifera TaxID=671143 RepID=D5MMA0_METO1|nr:protein of unknown function [Candidatus Methylomirabilis oxyfera]